MLHFNQRLKIKELYEENSYLINYYINHYKLEDANIIFMDAIKRYNPDRGATFKTFLYNELKYGIKKQHRKNSAYKRLANFETCDVDVETIAGKNSYFQMINDIKTACTKIEFSLLVMYYIKGNTQREISEQLKIPQPTISRQIKKIIKKIRGYYGNN